MVTHECIIPYSTCIIIGGTIKNMGFFQVECSLVDMCVNFII